MADFSNIIQEINADINTNGSRQITGAKLNQVLRDMITAVNAEKQDPMAIDATPTEDSTNPVQSGGVYDALGNLYQALSVAENCLFGGIVTRYESPIQEDGHRYYYITHQVGYFQHFDVTIANDEPTAVMIYWSDAVSKWVTVGLWPKLAYIEKKADKVDGATQGNLAGLDAYGNLTDSGIAASDVATTADLAGKQDTISDLATIRSNASLGTTAIQSSEKGVATGVATLNNQGKVPVSQLPSYVDDVLEYANLAAFPATGESGKIYVAHDTNKTYRWGGSAYVEISPSLALGETSSTAFAGNRGKAIEDKIPSNASSSNKMATIGDVVTDYPDLADKPQINSVTLSDNKSASDLGLATSAQGNKADTAYQKPSSGIPESDLSSDVQQALQKHFKGWYASSSALPANPVVGDYAYVKGAESTDPAAIYECTTAGSWSDSGRTADTSNVQTFASSQEVNEVHLVNDCTTGGINDVLTAEQGKLLKQKIDERGIILDITQSANLHNSLPATPASSDEPNDGSDWAGHYINVGNGNVTTSSSYAVSYYIPVVGGQQYKSNKSLRTVCFFIQDKTFKSVTPYLDNISAGTAITAPDDAAFIRFCYYVSNGSPSPSDVKFGKFSDNIDVDYVHIVRDFDSQGQEILLKKDIQAITVGTEQILDGSVTNAKLQDKTITNDKIKYPLPIVVSKNLFDKNTMIDDGHYINNEGVYASAPNWAMTDYIEIEPNTDYFFYADSWGRSTGYVWYDNSKSSINPTSTGSATIAGVHTSPLSAKYVRFNIKSGGTNSVNVMLAKSSQAIPYEEYGVVSLPTSAIKDFSAAVANVVGIETKLTVTKNGNDLTVAYGNDYVKFELEKNYNDVFSANPVCNIYKRKINNVENNASDDIAPMHVLNTTLGANHAQPVQKVTVTSHGLTNESVGTEWVNGSNVKFYIVRIVDANNILIISENTRSYLDPIRVKLSQGDTLTNNGTTITVESVIDTQMRPGLKNHQIVVMCDNNPITEDGDYTCNKVSICEHYDIMNPESVLQNLIANVGSSEEPIYDGDSAVRVENIYEFCGSMTMTVLNTVVFLEAVRFGDIMSSQLTKAASKYYIPNSLPIATGIDLRTPSVVSWTSSTPLCNVTQDKVKNTEYPINRVIQYGDNVGYAIGYLQDSGVARKINNYTTVYFEIRNNSGKIYPHPVDNSKTLTYQQVGNIYTSLIYVAPFVPEPSNSARLSAYIVKHNESTYVYVDYIDSILDKVVIDNSLDGKKITVIESSNATLISMDNNTDDEVSNDVYNNGFYVNASYVSGETCYIVLKIE